MPIRNGDIAREIKPILDSLLDLYRSTNPLSSRLTERQKAKKARDAVRLWGMLGDHLINWAECELVGGQLVKRNAEAISTWHEFHKTNAARRRDLPEAVGLMFWQQGKVDAEQEEQLTELLGKEGFKLIGFLSKNGADEAEAVVQELLAPPRITRVLRASEIGQRGSDKYDGLRQLTGSSEVENVMSDFGEGETKPADDNLAEDSQWKLEALRRVRMLIGKGYRKIFATAEIADLVGHRIEDFQEWERNLVKVSDIENDLYCAELAGEFEGHFVSGHYSNIDSYKMYGMYDGTYNMARASAIARKARQIQISDIWTGLRDVG